MTQQMIQFYMDKTPHSNQELFTHFSNIYGECNQNLQHTLRGLQQNLKKQGLIKNIAYGIWTA